MTRQPYATVPLLDLHIPVIEPKIDGGVWGVYCYACMRDIGDRIYPCRRGHWRDIPPREVIER